MDAASPTGPDDGEQVAPVDDADVVTRRAPFSDNPRVGVRGQRTQQRILDAAIRVFGEQGYHQCSIDRITKVAGCSRVSFYQYFAGKEDLYRTLSGQVARQLSASLETLGMVTPTAAGWTELQGWASRHAGIYRRYEPIFEVFREAAETDEAVAGGSARVTRRNLSRFCSKLAVTELPTRRLEAVVALLLESLTRTLRTAASLRTGADGAYDEDRIVDAFTDVVHRTLFGPLPGLNVREATTTTPPTLDPGPVLRAVGRRDRGGDELTATGRRTLESLLRAGQDVFVRRGYHQTRVDDIVTEAGVSHGAFYRYFQNKDDLAHTIAVGAMRRVSTTFGAMPEMTPGGSDDQRSELRRWLRRYEEAYSTEYAVIQVWVDAAVEDPSLADDSAAVVDWGRRRMADFLRPRGFGDVDHESVVMLALLVTFGNRTDDDGSLDAAAYVVERGLFAT